uniref:Uncharacterized protein n=1 Tax=Plectus sambesii TaxID=2011161 RepID=A0A914XFH6_9BILA
MENKVRRKRRLTLVWKKSAIDEKVVSTMRPMQNGETSLAAIAPTERESVTSSRVNELLKQLIEEKMPSTAYNDNQNDIMITGATQRNSYYGQRKPNERLVPKEVLDDVQAHARYFQKRCNNKKQLESKTASSGQNITLRSLLDSSHKVVDKSAGGDVMEQLTLQTTSLQKDRGLMEGERLLSERAHCSSCQLFQGALVEAQNRNKGLEELITILQLKALQADEQANSSEQSVHNLITDMCLLQRENEVLQRRLDLYVTPQIPQSEQVILKLPTVLWREILLD